MFENRSQIRIRYKIISLFYPNKVSSFISLIKMFNYFCLTVTILLWFRDTIESLEQD